MAEADVAALSATMVEGVSVSETKAEIRIVTARVIANSRNSRPVMSPDARHFATADVCAQECDNEVAVWRIARDGVRKEAAWTPPATWSDVSATWRNGDALVLEYSLPGEARPRTIERRLDDPSWKKLRAQ